MWKNKTSIKVASMFSMKKIKFIVCWPRGLIQAQHAMLKKRCGSKIFLETVFIDIEQVHSRSLFVVYDGRLFCNNHNLHCSAFKLNRL